MSDETQTEDLRYKRLLDTADALNTLLESAAPTREAVRRAAREVWQAANLWYGSEHP